MRARHDFVLCISDPACANNPHCGVRDGVVLCGLPASNDIHDVSGHIGVAEWDRLEERAAAPADPYAGLPQREPGIRITLDTPPPTANDSFCPKCQRQGIVAASQCLRCGYRFPVTAEDEQVQAVSEQQERIATPLRTFAEIQREWLDAVQKYSGDQALTVNDIIALGILGNQLLLEMNLTGMREGLER